MGTNTLRTAIDAAIVDRATAFAPIVLAGGQAIDRGDGIIELVPDDVGAAGPATILSAGIHGNETAPVELIQSLASALDDGSVSIGAPVLLIVGYPASIVARTRFIETNLNRLFQRETSGTAREYARAAVLMAAVDRFWATWPALPTTLHLDMHTAIRESHYPRFAVEPASTVETSAETWQAMAAAGIEAVLFQTADSWTFSHYSRFYHARQAFTLELGRVAPFGENDLNALVPMQRWLAARVAAIPAPATAVTQMAFFRAGDELIRVSEDFELAFADDVPNFSAFDSGTLLARDGVAGETRVEDGPVHVVFPNARVERGARAALLARPVSAPG